nr:aminoacyl-tRNA synthetase, class 1a, anticodon-binding [Tanacetum cinerariifolium]
DQQAAILEAERQELLEQELKQSLDAEQIYLDNLLAQRVAEEQERESKVSAAQSTQRQAELDRITLNLTNKEWIGLVDQVRANQNLSAELLGDDVSKDTFATRMNVYDKIRRVVDLNNAKAHHHHFKRSGDTLESSESKKLKSSPSVEQPAELQKPPSISVGSTIAVGALNSTVPSVFAVLSDSAASLVPADTPIAAGVPTTIAASGSTKPTTLNTVKEDRDVSIIWDDQDQWEIRSWRFYPLPAIYVLETEAGDIIYMFVDKKYP